MEIGCAIAESPILSSEIPTLGHIRTVQSLSEDGKTKTDNNLIYVESEEELEAGCALRDSPRRPSVVPLFGTGSISASIVDLPSVVCHYMGEDRILVPSGEAAIPFDKEVVQAPVSGPVGELSSNTSGLFTVFEEVPVIPFKKRNA